MTLEQYNANSKLPPGHGQIKCYVSPSTTKPSFSTFHASYPIKLLTPKLHSPYLAAVYIITYGGGMVSGDSISLSVESHPNVNLMLLTQGSTKIYKQRPGRMFVNNNSIQQNDEEVIKSEGTQQKVNAFIHKDSLLLQLPEPTTCFRDAEFTQRQIFTLQDRTSSVVILDWFTCGRMSRGERWDFLKYDSGIDLILGDKLILRDVVLLKKNHHKLLKTRLEPYECYATLVLYGPKVIPLINSIMEEFNKIVIDKISIMPNLIWSASILGEKHDIINGVVVKIAGITTELVRNFLIKVSLKGLEDIVGENLFERAL
ncbi:3538_t:CDS:1 [Funneliformis geosporum]|nr:3538_t:CDS:1 [Funneliformis geosporum]